MKRFIRYLYEYEGNQKKRNVGFVKIEQDGKGVAISVHGKGLCGKGNENISCYLLKIDGETGNAVLIPVGEMRIGMTSCGGSFCYTEEIEDHICGMGLGNPGGPFYMALWNEEMYGDFDVTKAVVKVPGEPETPETRQETANINKVEDEITESQNGDKKEIEEAGESPDEDKKEIEETRESSRQIMKIQRGEISILPRCEWKLANNHFLLHGYYNYRHLVLIDEGEKLKLGVPGIYHEREAQAAATFGFPEFIAKSDIDVTLEPQEQNEEQTFGYWCRQVRRPSR